LLAPALEASTLPCASNMIYMPMSSPAKSWAGIKTRFDDVDIVIVRENTEGCTPALSII